MTIEDAGEAIDDDLVVEHDGTLVFAHSRHECTKFPFGASSDRRDNEKCCDKCFCYVCDTQSSNCMAWPVHCMAHDKSSAWKSMRDKARRDAAAPPQAPGAAPAGATAQPVTAEDTAQGQLARHGKASFPRAAGFFDFLMVDCCLHEHDSVPHNCELGKYFNLDRVALPAPSTVPDVGPGSVSADDDLNGGWKHWKQYVGKASAVSVLEAVSGTSYAPTYTARIRGPSPGGHSLRSTVCDVAALCLSPCLTHCSPPTATCTAEP